MVLTFQDLMQYCYLQHQTFLPSPVTFTTGCCFCFGSVSSFFSVISPLFSSSTLGTYQSRQFIFHCPIFLSFHTVHGALKAKILKWFAFPCPADHVLSEISTMAHLSWVALHGMAYSFTELDKAVVHVISLISFPSLQFSFLLPSDG